MEDWLARFDPSGTAENLSRSADRPGDDARARFERALARMMLGRDAEARADLVECQGEIGDAALVEIAYLDVRGRGGVEAANATLESVLQRAPRGSELEARTLHVLGLARGKLRQGALATDALLRAAQAYRALGASGPLAQVQDTLGSVFAAQGRLDFATAHYAASLVGKLASADTAGIALTLGNLGRLQMRAGRFFEALDCFRLDLALAASLGDERGVARMHEDIGRAWMGLERHDEARAELARALSLAEAGGWRDLVFFARHDLALVDLATGRLDEADAELASAEAALAEPRDGFLAALLLSARGRVLAARADERAIAMLEDACARFTRLDLPDHEIQARLALCESRLGRCDRAGAEREIARALELARLDGYARWLPPVREAMGRLQIVESAVDERGRLSAPGGRPVGADGYQLLSRLGSGAFGEVWRAYDPQRAQVVALKRLSLDRLYDPEARERRLGSARAELAAASRLRHPGIARVHAFGLDDAQRAYIVQEYVEGPSLRARMSASRSTSAGRVLDVAGKIARALQTLHRANVVHRDLKPENVILRLPHEHPVLIDFGLVLVADGPLDAASIVGTPAYMAPEQLAGRPVAGPCDLYALGVILYEWWAGCRPLQLNAASYEENLHVLTNRAPDPIAGLRPDLGLECTELVDALLEKDPADRPTVDDVAAHCEEWARKLLGRG